MTKFADLPRSKFADPEPEAPAPAIRIPYTVAWVIQRVMDEVAQNPDMKQYGPSQSFALCRIQREPIGAKDARTLTRQEVIEYAKQLRAGKGHKKQLKACTIGQYLSYLGVTFDYASATWDDCEKVTRAPIIAAKPFLKKQGLVGKAMPRKRRPTDEEIERLLEHFRQQQRYAWTKTRMDMVLAFALISSRRLGEICRIKLADVDFEAKVYWVRDVKHPTRKKGNDKRFILWPELAEIIRLQPQSEDGRIFPFNAHSASHSFHKACKTLGIEGLRFHDSRREAVSRWLKKLSPHQVRVGVSGHDNVATLERHYDGVDPLELIRNGVMQERPTP